MYKASIFKRIFNSKLYSKLLKKLLVLTEAIHAFSLWYHPKSISVILDVNIIKIIITFYIIQALDKAKSEFEKERLSKNHVYL